MNVNEAPNAIALSAATIAENNAANAVVGTLTGSDPDAGQSVNLTFVLASGAGATDNAHFTIAGNELKLNAPADFETKNSYTIRVRTVDAGGLPLENQFTVTITDVFENVSPTFSGYVAKARKNTPFNVPVSKILAKAEDSDGGTLTVSAVSASSTMGGTVGLAGGAVTCIPPAEFIGFDSFAVTVIDGQGGSVNGTITVFIGTGDPQEATAAQMAVQPDGDIALLFQVTPGQPSTIQRSADMESWEPLQNMTADADGMLPFLDTSPQARSFYRAVSR